MNFNLSTVKLQTCLRDGCAKKEFVLVLTNFFVSSVTQVCQIEIGSSAQNI